MFQPTRVKVWSLYLWPHLHIFIASIDIDVRAQDPLQ
ncbi:hypothetical protein LCGC14_1359180, partial [marine sediment metagenome]